MKHLLFLAFTLAILTGKAQTMVGIGTPTPAYPLTVIGQSSKGITQKNGSVELGFYTAGIAAYLQTWSNHSLAFTTAGTGMGMLLTTSGNLGIGTNSVSARLDVNGTIRLRGSTPAAGSILISDENGTAKWDANGEEGVKTMFVPFASFVGASDFMKHETVNGVSRRSPGFLAETYRFQAALHLPVGTSIKQITWYYFDNDVEHNLDFSLIRNQFGDPVTISKVSSSGTLNVDWTRTATISHTLENYFYWLEISSFSWSADESLRFKGALVTYE
jgi:hypothetical protein